MSVLIISTAPKSKSKNGKTARENARSFVGIRDRVREAFGIPADLGDTGDGAAARAVDTMPPDLIEYSYSKSSSDILELVLVDDGLTKPCPTTPALQKALDKTATSLTRLSHRRNSDLSGQCYIWLFVRCSSLRRSLTFEAPLEPGER